MINDSYRWPFIFSMLFHVALLTLLLFSFHDYLSYTASREVGASQNNPVIQAVAIKMAPPLRPTANSPQKAERESTVEHQKRPSPLAAEVAPKGRMGASIDTLKSQEIVKPTEKLIEKPAEHPILEKKQVDPKLKRSMERELQKQLARESAEQELASKVANEAKSESKSELKSEAKEAASQAGAAHVQGELDKYKALIIQAISQHWLIPDDVRPDLSCELLIKVDPSGEVLSVEIARSSGDVALDRSARAAVFKAGLLPVPKEAEVFDRFRELRLTVRPENAL